MRQLGERLGRRGDAATFQDNLCGLLVQIYRLFDRNAASEPTEASSSQNPLFGFTFSWLGAE